jgi:cellulose synthase (UDP-forming)
MRESYESPVEITKVSPPKKADILTIRFLISCGLISMIIFIFWFFDPQHIGCAPLYYFLTFALFFKLLKMVHEWYHYWSVSVPEVSDAKTKWSVDVLTTACPGEPKDMIIRTLKAMKAIKYPHTNYLCDEGNDPELRKVCEELGVVHVTRIEKKDAKAGNINNALRFATGDICVVLDPDHVPVPEFLDRVLPYFEKPEIGFVQCVQAYSNQSESFIAKGAAEQTYHFYGPMMMCMNTYGTVQVIGANCTFRRKALDSIGGHAAGLAEDMHTAMQLNAKGWKSVYVPEILTRGLVPATLSSYYKQQLKWSRGAFELLFRTYPSLFKKLNWRQKIHYMTIPLYFLFGLINFIDILIPMLALCFAEVPWNINVGHFTLFFLPLFGISMLIRIYAQQWLLEKKERGLHIAGGILRTASWWILLTGFVYAIFNIKVPYIPTPKEDEHENYLKLCIPNVITILVCAGCVWYGLSIDWTPYSMAMAFYGLITSVMLGYAAVMSQQRLLLFLKNKAINNFFIGKIISGSAKAINKTQYVIYSVKNRTATLTIGISLLFLNYGSIDDEIIVASKNKQKDFGGFYMGISSKSEDLSFVKEADNQLAIISMKQTWNTSDKNASSFILKHNDRSKTIPMINWEPEILLEEDVWKKISNGLCDKYLQKCATEIRAYKDPVFINFAPGFDDPKKFPQQEKTNASEDFKKAWQYIYTFFNNLGISNITWVWNPLNSSSTNFYPGPKFVDWIGVSCLNYGEKITAENWYSFSQIYNPFRNCIAQFQKPVMITEFGSLKSPDQLTWIKEARKDILKKFHEIRSVIICAEKKEISYCNKNSNKLETWIADFSFSSKEIPMMITSKDYFNKKYFTQLNNDYLSVKKVKYNSPFIKGTPGKFMLTVNNRPFYIRGVSYNTEHDWRDGNMPLTRKQLEKDLKRIKEMGANTIRRYDYGIYDRNILNISAEYDLKVLYGFWFDPEVDYYSDSLRVKEYISEVEKKVLAYKDHSAILAWSLGNETWGLLKHKFSKPYLTKVRAQYVKLVECLAQRIHELDPAHPVFSCMEHEIYQLPGELAAFHDVAPSLDVIGVNSYYKEQISQLNHVCWQFDSLRPYLVSEFGPRGYWDPDYNRSEKGSVIEDDEKEKASWYKTQWTSYVSGYRGNNIGGFAYCWHDRMEGSNTWFGLTDYSGRTKPSYYALKELWTGVKSPEIPNYMIAGSPKIIPGATCYFKAVPQSGSNENYTYEWVLNKNEYLEKVNNIKYLDDGENISVKIPDEPSDYRLYLYVSDKNGNVTTASLPVKVT